MWDPPAPPRPTRRSRARGTLRPTGGLRTPTVRPSPPRARGLTRGSHPRARGLTVQHAATSLLCQPPRAPRVAGSAAARAALARVPTARVVRPSRLAGATGRLCSSKWSSVSVARCASTSRHAMRQVSHKSRASLAQVSRKSRASLSHAPISLSLAQVSLTHQSLFVPICHTPSSSPLPRCHSRDGLLCVCVCSASHVVRRYSSLGLRASGC